MNCATTNAFFVNEKLLFRNGITWKLDMVVGTLRGMPKGIHTVDLVCRPPERYLRHTECAYYFAPMQFKPNY